jgi:(p)ppGpp synthase/HD superfamily hydrolase
LSDHHCGTVKTFARDLLAAAHFAAQRHAGQRRKGKSDEPYVNHLLEVARLLAELPTELDCDVVIAGLLHDCMEDAGVTSDEIAAQFGERVASLVQEVTDDKTLDRQVRKELQVRNAASKSRGAQNLSTADKISNLRSTLADPPSTWSPDQQWKYAEWAKDIVGRFTEVDPALKLEFERVHRRFIELEERRGRCDDPECSS